MSTCTFNVRERSTTGLTAVQPLIGYPLTNKISPRPYARGMNISLVICAQRQFFLSTKLAHLPYTSVLCSMSVKAQTLNELNSGYVWPNRWQFRKKLKTLHWLELFLSRDSVYWLTISKKVKHEVISQKYQNFLITKNGCMMKKTKQNW